MSSPSFAPGAPPVALLRWPDEAARRAELAAAGQPRLLLVHPDAPPPRTWGPAEDWVRLPVDQAELDARVAALARRGPEPPTGPRPVLDGDDVLHVGSRRVPLPPIEAALLGLLIHRAPAVVPRDELAAAGWPGGPGDRGLLDSRMKLLRRRVAPLGVEIDTVRGVGYLLPV